MRPGALTAMILAATSTLVAADANAVSPEELKVRDEWAWTHLHHPTFRTEEAPTPVVPRAPRPGLDRNDDTLRSRGSVVFSVKVAEKEAFRSEVMRVDTPARSVDVDLDGATSLVLEVRD